MSISVVILAYKEAENLKVLLPQIKEQMNLVKEDYEVVVIDTAEALDDTQKVCEAFEARYVNQRYPFFGGAFRTGIEEANNDIFLILDGDGSHNPKYIPAIYDAFILGSDIVIGSRYVKGGSTADSKMSVAMSKVLNFCFRIVLGVKVKDVSTDYRMYDTKQLKKVSLKCKNYDILEEVIMKMKLNNKKLCLREVPISFEKRMYGESKRQLFKFICGYIGTLFRMIGMRISHAFSR